MMFIVIVVVSGILTKLYVEEHYEVISDIIRRIETEVAKVPALQMAYDTLIAAFNHEEAAYNRRKLIESAEMVEINKWRLGLVATLFSNIRLRRKSFDAGEKNAAKLLKAEIVDKFPRPYKHTKEGKTGYIDGLLKALGEAKYQQALIKLNLVGLVNEIASANYQYNIKLDIVTDVDKQNKEIGSPTDVRPVTDEALKELMLDIEAVHRYNERTAKDETVREAVKKIAFIINGILDEAKRNDAHKRHSRKHENPADQANDSSPRTDAATDTNN
jgi:hypothetical protein